MNCDDIIQLGKRLIGCAILASIAIAPVAAQEPDGTDAIESAASLALGAIDDGRIFRKLRDDAAALISSGRATKMSVLVEQLKAERCQLETAPQAKTVPFEELYERMKPGVLVISAIRKSDNGSNWLLSPASGFVLSASGVCCTNYHVVNHPESETLVAMTADGQVLPVTAVLAASKNDDVAILQVNGKGLSALPLGATAPVGSRISLISHPDNRFFVFTSGIVSRYFLTRRNGTKSPMMAITADYAKGSSGAPVFNDRGEVAGMVASTQSIYYDTKNGKAENLQMVVKQCVPVASILKLIERPSAARDGAGATRE